MVYVGDALIRYAELLHEHRDIRGAALLYDALNPFGSARAAVGPGLATDDDDLRLDDDIFPPEVYRAEKRLCGYPEVSPFREGRIDDCHTLFVPLLVLRREAEVVVVEPMFPYGFVSPLQGVAHIANSLRKPDIGRIGIPTACRGVNDVVAHVLGGAPVAEKVSDGPHKASSMPWRVLMRPLVWRK